MQKLLPKRGLVESHFSGKKQKVYNHGGGGLELPDDHNASWGEGGGEFARVQDFIFLDKVKDLVTGYIYYPRVYAKYGIKGSVKVRLVINDQGQCDLKKSRFYIGQRHLSLFVRHQLFKMCKHSLKLLPKMRKSSNIDMSFRFELVVKQRNLDVPEDQVVGNVLMFHRTHINPNIEWELGPFKGIWGLPIVNVNFDWLGERWSQNVDNQPPPMERFLRSLQEE